MNPKGEIVFKGHPSSIDLEKAIDDLLATGESSLCPLKKAEECGATGSSLNKPQSEEKASGLIAAFKAKVKELNDDEQLVKDLQSSGAQRAFFVCEQKGQFNSSKGEFENELTLHLVLIGGSKAVCDKIKEATKDLRADEAFTVREQVMGQKD